jgi:ABC-type protease/lipase transport system fused ATPase/permease subunit
MTRGEASTQAGLRLRDVGITPLTVATVITLSCFGQLVLSAFILLLRHITDGVMETRNSATLIGFMLLFAFTVAVSGLYNHLRAAIFRAAAERLGLRLQAQAMQAAIRNAVRTDTGNGLPVLQDINHARRFLASSGPVAFLDLLGAAIALAVLFYLDTTLGLVGALGILIVLLLSFVT